MVATLNQDESRRCEPEEQHKPHFVLPQLVLGQVFFQQQEQYGIQKSNSSGNTKRFAFPMSVPFFGAAARLHSTEIFTAFAPNAECADSHFE
jgi:hypothetical protein